jgi:hypothetical protein
MTKRTNRRPENLVKHDGSCLCRLTREDRACGFHQGQSTRMLANRPVIVTQSFFRSSPPQPLQLRGSPYSPRCGALNKARSAAAQASLTNALLGGKEFTPLLYVLKSNAKVEPTVKPELYAITKGDELAM